MSKTLIVSITVLDENDKQRILVDALKIDEILEKGWLYSEIENQENEPIRINKIIGLTYEILKDE